VYNGDKFIRSRLENILSQTFQDFKLIISDNASTDMTPKICQEFVSKDDRIQYFWQDNNIGGILNYIFVANKSTTKYFVFATADDKWSKTFLSKNIRVLDENDSVVGSIGKIQWSDENIHDEQKLKPKINKLNNFQKKIQSFYGRIGSFSIMEKTYEDRAIIFLKELRRYDPSNILYSIFRTKALQKSIISKVFVKEFYSSFWNNVCLNILEYGNIKCSNDVQIFYYAGGSGEGVTPITQYQKKQITLMQCIIPWSTQISWCIHKFGLKFFFKHFILFSQLFLQGEITFVHSIYRYLKK